MVSDPARSLYLESCRYQFNLCGMSLDDLPGGFVVEDPAVVVGAGEFGCGFFVEAEDGGGVELERGGRIHRGDGAFDGLSYGLGFIFSRGEEDGFACVENGSDTHGDDMEWHRVLAPEEAGVVLAGAGGKGFDARAGGEGGCRFVEANVAVSADAEELEVDAACCADFFLVAAAEFFGVRCHTVWDMDVFAIDVHMPEEVLVHERMVGLRMVGSDADVFVQIKRGDLRPIEVLLDELFVEWHGGAASGEAKNRIGPGADEMGEEAGGHASGRFGIGLDDDFHRVF